MSTLQDSHKAQNLARIRDNQRRSRARRKEYLHELEAKLRSCEQVGIEASSEIQMAARKVLDENRKLRGLLYDRGASEPEIAAALGAASDQPYDQVSATPILSAMLERRFTTTFLSSTSSSSPPEPPIRATSLPRHMPSVQPTRTPASRPAALGCTGSSSPRSLGAIMKISSSPSFTTPVYGQSTTTLAAEIKTEDAYSDPYNQYNSSWTYPSSYNYIADPTTYHRTTFCADATNAIRTTGANAVPESATDLACRVTGQHCYINNGNVIFNMMDKHSNHHATIPSFGY